MAEVTSLEAAKVAAGTKLRNDEALGRLHVVTISSPLAAAATAWAQNDTIASPVNLPVGTRFVDCWVHHEAMGTSVTMDIGIRQANTAQTVIDVDGIADGLNVAAAGQTHGINGVMINVSATQAIYRTALVSNIYATLLSADPDDGQVFRIDVTVALAGG